MFDRPQKITFAEMRESGVRGLLIYCADYHCSHSDSDRSVGSPAASFSLGQIPSAPRTRNAIPPHVADENPKGKTQNQNSIDQSIEHASAALGNAHRAQHQDSTKKAPLAGG